jgi:hypothetical protein
VKDDAIYCAIQFMRNALATGSIVAVLAAAVGFFIVARSLTFAAHAIPNIGFAGAAGAVLAGVQPVYGLFAFTIAAAIGIGILGDKIRERDIVVAVLMTFALGLGFLFLSLYSGYAQRLYGILFGSILGISVENVLVTAAAGAVALGRPPGDLPAPAFQHGRPLRGRGARPSRHDAVHRFPRRGRARHIALRAGDGSPPRLHPPRGTDRHGEPPDSRPPLSHPDSGRAGTAYVWIGIASRRLSGDSP